MGRLPHGGEGGRRLRAVAVDTLLPARANSACTLDRLLGNGCDWLTVSLRRAAARTHVSKRTKPRGSWWLLHWGAWRSGRGSTCVSPVVRFEGEASTLGSGERALTRH
jgi:hypothetical protein